MKNVGRHVATLGEEKIDLGRGFLVGPFLGHRRAFREQFTGAVSPASEWPCNVLQTFYRGGQRSPGGASGEGGWQTISTGRTLCLMFGHVFRSGHAFCYHILCMFARLKCCFSARATHSLLHRLDTLTVSTDRPWIAFYLPSFFDRISLLSLPAFRPPRSSSTFVPSSFKLSDRREVELTGGRKIGRKIGGKYGIAFGADRGRFTAKSQLIDRSVARNYLAIWLMFTMRG